MLTLTGYLGKFRRHVGITTVVQTKGSIKSTVTQSGDKQMPQENTCVQGIYLCQVLSASSYFWFGGFLWPSVVCLLVNLNRSFLQSFSSVSLKFFCLYILWQGIPQYLLTDEPLDFVLGLAPVSNIWYPPSFYIAKRRCRGRIYWCFPRQPQSVTPLVSYPTQEYLAQK